MRPPVVLIRVRAPDLLGAGGRRRGGPGHGPGGREARRTDRGDGPGPDLPDDARGACGVPGAGPGARVAVCPDGLRGYSKMVLCITIATVLQIVGALTLAYRTAKFVAMWTMLPRLRSESDEPMQKFDGAMFEGRKPPLHFVLQHLGLVHIQPDGDERYYLSVL